MYNHQKSSDRAPRHHREGLPGCVLLPNFRSRVPGSFGASVTDPSGWSVLPRNRHEQLCSEQESSGLSFLQFSVSFEIRISSFLLLVNFYGEKIAGACPDFQNLKPGKHGFHIHEKGDCSAPDAMSAGPHFNPKHQHHDGPTGTERHAGDFGNVEADASGKGHLEWKGKLDLSGPNSIIGKSVIVHEKEDDLKTDPAGNSGARFACGVINAAE